MTSQKILTLVEKFFPGSIILPPDNFYIINNKESERITPSQAGKILALSKKNKKNYIDKDQLSLI
ncbi:hypothetical protein [Flavobacterium sp.]|uniref:hypothetical protein n=1 Tax=Flavobacterium sp. TaxID=239 RepID=UPI0038FD27DB